MPERGLLIAMEGLDGAGTTTQTERLVGRLERVGARAHATREPSDGPVGKLIREALARRWPGRDAQERVAADSLALLFAADRIDHLAHELEPRLSAGVHVISDRYVLSSLAYQGMECDGQWVRVLNAHARPADLTIFLQVEPEVALGRVIKRGGTRDIYEQLEFQKQVHEGYEKALRKLPAGTGLRIDGAPAPDAVEATIWHAVSRRLGLPTE